MSVLENLIDEYFLAHDDIYGAIQKKIIDAVNAMIPYDLDVLIRDKFTAAIVSVEHKHKSNIGAIEDKLERMARNQDALYLEIQALKRVKL